MRSGVRRMPRPALVVAVAGLTLLIVLPAASLLARAPWGQFGSILAGEGVRQAALLSLLTSVSAATIAVAFGVPLGVALGRAQFKGVAVIRGIVAVPVVLPPVVGGVALLAAFGRAGVLGDPLQQIGVRLPFTTAGAILAAAFVAFPFVVLAVEAAVRQSGVVYEEAAATLGAGPGRRMRRVTLPLIAPSIAAGAALAWARALGEFGATITFAGSLPGSTQTLPLQVYRTLETDPRGAIALSVMLLIVSVAVIAALGSRLRAGATR